MRASNRYTLRNFATTLALALVVTALGCRKPAPPHEGASAQRPSSPAPAARPEDPVASLRLNPPKVLDIAVAPLQGDARGTATLTLTVADDARLGKTLQIEVAGQPVALARERGTPMTFSGPIDFDFDAFAKDMAALEPAWRQRETRDIFRGRHEVGLDPRMLQDDVRLDPEVLSRLAKGRNRFHIPPHFIDIGWLFVDAPRELLITDLSVVEDPARTFDPCTNAGTPGGAWTFGKLMTDMAHQPVTGVDPADFVAGWLRTWLAAQTINGFVVGARASMQAILDNWPKRPDGKLDVNRAPFRLLAIVNRLDLRKGGGYTKGDAGEGRFVFGLVGQDAGGGCSGGQTRPMTVILEYGVPISGCFAVHDYAAKWVALGDIPLGDAAFNPALQAVTDVFAAAGAGGSKPNGSAINQIRTNEIALGSPWELREFHVEADHHLHTVMPVLVPDSSLNRTAAIDDFIAANEAAILNKTYTVPDQFPSATSFRAGASTNDLQAWRGATNDPSKTDARHVFSLGTCNACHGGEALDTSVGTGDQFLHVRNRSAGAAASLSLFLTGGGTLASPTYFNFPDPFIPSKTRPMGDLQDRRKDLAGLPGNCRATGLFKDLVFKPLGMPH